MNGQRSDGVRTKEDATTTSNSSITAIDDTGDACDKIHARAHTLHTAEVALDLATNLEYVQMQSTPRRILTVLGMVWRTTRSLIANDAMARMS